MKKLTAPEKRTIKPVTRHERAAIVKFFYEGWSMRRLARASGIGVVRIESIIRADAIKRERAKK